MAQEGLLRCLAKLGFFGEFGVDRCEGVDCSAMEVDYCALVSVYK